MRLTDVCSWLAHRCHRIITNLRVYGWMGGRAPAATSSRNVEKREFKTMPTGIPRYFATLSVRSKFDSKLARMTYYAFYFYVLRETSTVICKTTTIQDLCVPVTTISTRAALRSAARRDLVLPRTRRRLGNRTFCVAGPAAWNSLPSDIRTA